MIILNKVVKNTKYSKILYNISLLLLTSLYFIYVIKERLWVVNNYRDLFLFIFSMSIYILHMIIYITCEKTVKRFELTRLLIKHKNCVFTDKLNESINISDIFLKMLLYIDVIILICHIVRSV